MTLVVATALGETPDELYERARLAAKSADWVEVRLDGPSGLPWDLRFLFAHDTPCIATVRAVEDGGRSHADDDARGDLLRRSLKAGAKAIDVEVWHRSARSLVADARDAGAMAIVSMHDLSGTPPVEKLLATLREMRALGADVAKVATRVNAPEDAAALVMAAQGARAEGIPCALMAVNDPFLRLLAPALGMALAYGSVPGQPAAAPGQVPAPLLREAHARAPRDLPSGATRAAFLLGHPVAHSKSPAMLTAAFRAAGVDACYLALDVTDLPAAFAGLRATAPLGANVTAPHKEAALPLCDDLDASARAAGAVNALEFRDGRIVGHNTDGAGALDALHEAGVRPQRALVLGAGGAARGVASALLRAGAAVSVANRTPEKATAFAAALGARALPWEDVPAMLQRADLLANCTTVGMRDDASPVPASALPARGLAVLDAVYKPGGTTLVRDARARGLVAVPGESMLLHQGARAFRLWTGRDAPLSAMREALR